MSEEWRPVDGFNGYEVSDLGRVRRRLARGGFRILRGASSVSGYVYIALRRNGETHRRTVHAMVMRAFVGACPAGMEVRHFPDPDVKNNALSNLLYGTRSQNACDRHAHGTMTLAKLTEEQVREIKNTPPRTKGLAEKFGVTRSAIRNARSGKTWKHVAQAGESP